MFTIAAPRLPRRDVRFAVSTSMVAHLAALSIFLATRGVAPIEIVPRPAVTYFELAPPNPGPPAPVATTPIVSDVPGIIELPELRLESALPFTFSEVTPTISPQDIAIPSFSAGSYGLVAAGPTTTLPVLVNEVETERTLRERVANLDVATDTVALHILVDERGRVRETRIAESSGSASFDRIATEVVTQTGRFLPAHQNGNPVAVWVEFPVSVEEIALLSDQ